MSKKLTSLLTRFVRDTQGNVAVLFGLSVIPLIGFIGVAVDYTRANNARTAMQGALDSTALMLSKDAATLTKVQLNEKANVYFKSMFNNVDTTNLTVTAEYTPSSTNQAVILTAAGTVPTEFVHILGFNQIPINTEATAAWGTTRLRVALVLDTTGSMSDAGKMTALKPAAKGLIDQLAALEKSPGDVYISIVPFSKDVNIGASNHAASWLNWSAWDAANGSCSKDYNSKNRCLNNEGIWTPKSHDQWNGCVTDRDQNYDVTNVAPTADTPGTMFWPEQYASCPSELMAFSTDWTALKNKIDALYPAGNTNQTIGLAWGWQMMNTSPFTYPPETTGYNYKKAIVLMSDGLNTQNRWTSSEWSIDQREAALCANVKAAGVTLYTIHVNTNGDPTSTVLQNCASSSDKFYTMTDATQLSGVFNQIASQLTMLRLAK